MRASCIPSSLNDENLLTNDFDACASSPVAFTVKWREIRETLLSQTHLCCVIKIQNHALNVPLCGNVPVVQLTEYGDCSLQFLILLNPRMRISPHPPPKPSSPRRSPQGAEAAPMHNGCNVDKRIPSSDFATAYFGIADSLAPTVPTVRTTACGDGSSTMSTSTTSLSLMSPFK